ncbi:MAG: (2Fe-2S) ferredoxin domain-containing protein, partial [Chloroflexota bacterium]|nr:(2Fe-2S) ferredoxin domain-containing protein [Chloroflexota bacterium]
HGLCGLGPSLVVEPDGIFYLGVEVRDAEEIVSSQRPWPWHPEKSTTASISPCRATSPLSAS